MKNKILLILLLVFSISNYLFSAIDYLAKGIANSNGRIIEGESINIKHPLASVTKTMTSLVVLDKIDQGTIKLTDMVVVSKEAANLEGSKIPLRTGEKISVKDLLYATMIHSANNAAYALAEYTAGSVDRFIVMMNSKAKELGMINTKYYTPTGLPMKDTPLDVGTIRDTVKLVAYAKKNKLLMDIVALKKVGIKNNRLTIYNRNKMLGKIDGVNGLKTGHHDKAGYNIAVTVNRKGEEFIVVVFGSVSEASRDLEVEKTIDLAYDNLEKKELMKKGEFLLVAPVEKGKERSVSLYANEDINIYVNKNWQLERIAKLPRVIKAPINKGSKIGYYIIKHNNREIAKIDLIAKDEIKESNWFEEIQKKFD